MKNRFFGFLRKYWFCFLLSIIMVIGVSLTTRYANLYVSGRGTIRFDLQAMYLILGIPLFSLTYGCLSFVKLKKAWLPQLIIFVITCIYFFGANLIFDKEIDAWKNILFISVYPVVFSLIGTLVTAAVCFVIKSIKEFQN